MKESKSYNKGSMKVHYSDKEIHVELEYFKDKNADKRVDIFNHLITIRANGDFKHHLIEGIVNALKKVQKDNPHLGEI